MPQHKHFYILYVGSRVHELIERALFDAEIEGWYYQSKYQKYSNINGTAIKLFEEFCRENDIKKDKLYTEEGFRKYANNWD